MTDHVVDAERGLDGPPRGDEGGIKRVEFDRVDDDRARTTHKECQACGSPVDLRRPHAYARGWRTNKIGRVQLRIVLCDRECWTAWASRST